MIGRAPSAEELDNLVEQPRAALAADGTAIADAAAPRVPLEVWRKAAWRAGKSLDRPVRTVTHAGVVQAYLTDWPGTPDEERVSQRRLRAAIEATVSQAPDR